jgi:hypothetical protein
VIGVENELTDLLSVLDMVGSSQGQSAHHGRMQFGKSVGSPP